MSRTDGPREASAKAISTADSRPLPSSGGRNRERSLPSIADDLGGGLAGQQWTANAYLVTLASLLLIGGSLGDIFGERRVFAMGVLGFGVTSLLCALAPTIEVLVAARALKGVAGAVLTPAALAVIVAAALIMGAVFWAFVLTDDRTVKSFGVGLGVAILVDALLVRMVLVPAIMQMLGDRAWYMPRWLDRLLPNLTIEPAAEPAVVEAEPELELPRAA